MWLQRRLAASQTTPTPTTPITKRATAPTPFVGLTPKPSGDAGEHAIERPPQGPSSLPPRLTCPRGRQRTIDTRQPCCPDHECTYYGWVGRGNIRANGHPGSKPWRQRQWGAGQKYFQETHGTVLPATRVSPQVLVWAVGAPAEGLGSRAVARVFAVAPNTVLPCLVEAADQRQAFSRDVLPDLKVPQGQLDERFALLRAVKASAVSDAVALQRLSRSPQGVWAASDPVTQLRLTIEVGERTLALAPRVMHQVAPVSAPDCVPPFLTDGFKESTMALLTPYGSWVQPPRRQITGPAPNPRWMP